MEKVNNLTLNIVSLRSPFGFIVVCFIFGLVHLSVFHEFSVFHFEFEECRFLRLCHTHIIDSKSMQINVKPLFDVSYSGE